ncbi:MAG: glycoside hydrolase family 2 TIM barrel-domain containing protein [Pyrinomonadaceae bacterium]
MAQRTQAKDCFPRHPVYAALPEPGQKCLPLGFAALTILFDGSGRNRVEWLLTSEGTFEAHAVVDGRGERLDNRNHPSIIVWVPINESWGVPDIATSRAQQEHARTMYHLLRSLDQTRLVIDNDGWEHTDETDLFAIHDYAPTGQELAAKYKVLETDRTSVPRNGRAALAFGYKYNGTPIP